MVNICLETSFSVYILIITSVHSILGLCMCDIVLYIYRSGNFVVSAELQILIMSAPSIF
jgi:hypothetical protein